MSRAASNVRLAKRRRTETFHGDNWRRATRPRCHHAPAPGGHAWAQNPGNPGNPGHLIRCVRRGSHRAGPVLIETLLRRDQVIEESGCRRRNYLYSPRRPPGEPACRRATPTARPTRRPLDHPATEYRSDRSWQWRRSPSRRLKVRSSRSGWRPIAPAAAHGYGASSCAQCPGSAGRLAIAPPRGMHWLGGSRASCST
jgi:hypothetical protein